MLYINDVSEVISLGIETYFFTDDTKAFIGIFQQSDCEELQTDIHALQEWYDKWLLCFHPEKCKAMRIGKSRIDTKDHILKDGIHQVEYVESEKDIEVVIDNKLTFHQHISEKINKTNAIMEAIHSSMEYMNCTAFTLLYTALVGPHLEYAN